MLNDHKRLYFKDRQGQVAKSRLPSFVLAKRKPNGMYGTLDQGFHVGRASQS